MKNQLNWIMGVSFAVAVFGVSSKADSMQWMEQQLQEFKSDAKTSMKNPLNVQKYDPDTGEKIEVLQKFSKESIDSQDFIDQKNGIKQLVTNQSQTQRGRALIRANDRPQDLVDKFEVNRLHDMERLGLKASSLANSPWSGDYWGIYKLGIAHRYADRNFPTSLNWIDNINYFTHSSCSVNELSPAEKYDLLIGDEARTLTQIAINEGRNFYTQYGKVETWMGICHGWSMASMMLARPEGAIKLLAADGRTEVVFYPSDIKALASLIWAKAAPQPRVVGGRCNVKNPAEDANGRVVEPDCFDTNPGTWHLATVNQVGISRRSFIMDATYDSEVWNQPILGYQYSYFNPQNLMRVESLSEATVRVGFPNDRFARYRSPSAAYVVGVAMTLTYIGETRATPQVLDSVAQDRRVAVNYLYDLELDSSFNIMGGEWYVRRHPDFLWVPTLSARAYTSGDMYLDQSRNRDFSWNGQGPLSPEWRNAAKFASSKGQPLAKIVETLITLSALSGR